MGTPIQHNYDNQSQLFIRDKIAWENAIRAYNGTDPLEMWYNYICWYDYNSQIDPERKFRETLEKCLTLYEHVDCYKQDLRLVKLWIKYIDMQPNPLNLYQLLYQRGIGIRCACFYIGWSHYYESANAFKQAESVFNLGFQAQAEPYSELQEAHNKFRMSVSQRMLYNDSSSKKREQNHLIEQRQQITALSYSSQRKPDTNNQPIQESTSSQQQIQQQQQYQQQPAIQHIAQQPVQTVYQQPVQSTAQQSNIVTYHQNSNTYQQPEQNSTNPQQYPQQSTENANNAIEYQQSHVQQQNSTYRVQNSVQNTMPNQTQYVNSQSTVYSPSVYETSISTPQQQQYDPTSKSDKYAHITPINSSSNANNSNTQQQLTAPIAQKTVIVQGEDYTLQNVKISPNFALFSYNNYETWKPLLYLEEPYDENRRCIYQKNLVYPDINMEYSPEEIRARKFKQKQQLSDIITTTTQQQANQAHKQTSTTDVQTLKSSPTSKKIEEEVEISTTKPIQNSNDNDNFYVGDLEEQIEASTIRYALDSNGQTKNKVIKIKFRKEIPQSDNFGSTNKEKQETPAPKIKKPKLMNSINNSKYYLEYTKTFQSEYIAKEIKKPKLKNQYSENSKGAAGLYSINTPNSNNYKVVENRLDNNASIQQYNEDANSEFNSSLNDSSLDSNANCSTPCKKFNLTPSSSAQSSLKRKISTNSFNLNDDSMSYTYEQNSFFASEYDEELKKTRLENALSTIETHLKKPAIDPFNSELCKALLIKLNIPSRKENNVYKLINNCIPKLMGNTKQISVADTNFNIEKEVGRGSYGSVYKSLNVNTSEIVALKCQRPPNVWELYICMEVKNRIKNSLILPGFMDISSAIIAPNASIFVTEFSSYGSLLDVNNKLRQSTKKVMQESLVIHFSIQILQIIKHLHKCKIIHADIKPDNFLLMKIPNSNSEIPSLRLIDFGCAIDMQLFPEGTLFKKIIQTEGFTCTEMQEGRHWSYQTDLFCVAGTIHVLLFGDYMQVSKKYDNWEIKQKLPRYLKKHMWSDFFLKMLNIKDENHLPNLQEIIDQMEEEIYKMDSELQAQIRALSNILHRR